MKALRLPGETGQALVLVALSMFALLGGLALAVDWGYGFSVRRSLQGASDAAALGVGRTLATSTVVIGGTLRFMPTDGTLWSQANTLAAANYGSLGGVAMTLQYGNATPTWTSSGGAGSNVAIPNNTVYVRVRLTTTYRSLFASLVGRPTLDAAGSARVRLSGADLPSTLPIVNFTTHFSTGMFSTTCPGACVDPGQANPVSLWSSAGPTWGGFRGALDYSRYSDRQGGTVLQLMSDWDRTASAAAGGSPRTAFQTGGGCSGERFDTAGNEDNANQNEICSGDEWMYWGFGGEISLTSDYGGVNSPREKPTKYPSESKGYCDLSDDEWQSTYGYMPTRAACDRGDWVETITRDTVDTDMIFEFRGKILNQGATELLSSRVVPAGGPNPGSVYGNGLTILLYLWDCAERYNSGGGVGSKWSLNTPAGNDCTNPTQGSGASEASRVHLFMAAPVTIYRGLVGSSAIQGFWGGAFGTPPADAPRPLWVFANTAYLVPDP